MRADALMVRRGLAASRDRAQALIAEGGVLVDGMPLAKPAKKLPPDAEITMTTVDIPWVSRGALKLVVGLDLGDKAIGEYQSIARGVAGSLVLRAGDHIEFRNSVIFLR